MLIAHDWKRDRIEASRDTAAGEYFCPLCKSGVLLKRGRIKVPHFAHLPDCSCGNAGESVRHLLAKRLLADEFRSLGYDVALEECHGIRRIDVAVTVRQGYRVAVEIQDSPISVDEAKVRTKLDRRLGFFATLWCFTDHRARFFRIEQEDMPEVRVPNEMRWASNRFGQGIFVVDTKQRRIWNCSLHAITRDGGSSEWYTSEGELTGVDYPDRTLRAVKGITREPRTFRLTAKPTPYHRSENPDWTAIFAKGE